MNQCFCFLRELGYFDQLGFRSLGNLGCWRSLDHREVVGIHHLWLILRIGSDYQLLIGGENSGSRQFT